MKGWKSYGSFVGAMGYSPADANSADPVNPMGGWRRSGSGNPHRRSFDGNFTATVVPNKRGNGFGYVYSMNSQTGWMGPFKSEEDAMDHADSFVF